MMSIVELRVDQWLFNRDRTLATVRAIEETGEAPSILAWQPGPGRAHIGWQLMHIAVTEEKFARMRPFTETSLSEELIARFGNGSTPDERVPSLDEIRSVLDEARSHLLTTANLFTVADLGTIPNSLKERGWDVGTALKIVAWHETHHQGQAHITFNLWKASRAG